MGGSRRNRKDLDGCTFLFQKTAKETMLKGTMGYSIFIIYDLLPDEDNFQNGQDPNGVLSQTNTFIQQWTYQFCQKRIYIKPRFLWGKNNHQKLIRVAVAQML